MRYLHHLYNYLFSSPCQLCTSELNTNESLLCTYCNQALPRILTACIQCNTPLPPPAKHTQAELCGYCIANQRDWDFCIAAFAYDSPITELIHQFKYHNYKHAIEFFASAILDQVTQGNTSLPDLITHIPSHPKRFAARGYNQSYRLAAAISKKTSVPHLALFNKIQNTPQQTSLTQKERQTTLKNSFLLKSSMDVKVREKQIVIIDDVLTTGATCGALAKTLKSAGAKSVNVWCIART